MILAGFILVPGCKNEDTLTEVTTTLTADDAADAIASALGGSQGTGGLTAQLEEAASVAGGGTLGKVDGTAGVLFDTTVTRQRTGTYSYSYSFQYSWSLANANQFTISYGMHGMYDAPWMSSNDSASATFQVSNLLVGQSYLVSGIYNRHGTQTSKMRAKLGFQSTLICSTTDLLINKTTRRISSGTATITLYGQVSNGLAFSYSATVVFLGGQSATLTIGAKSYTVNLALGQVS
jgi:hypothetical protein